MAGMDGMAPKAIGYARVSRTPTTTRPMRRSIPVFHTSILFRDGIRSRCALTSSICSMPAMQLGTDPASACCPATNFGARSAKLGWTTGVGIEARRRLWLGQVVDRRFLQRRSVCRCGIRHQRALRHRRPYLRHPDRLQLSGRALAVGPGSGCAAQLPACRSTVRLRRHDL
jgi:hypothetical protein